MKKILLTLVGVICSLGMWADDVTVTWLDGITTAGTDAPSYAGTSSSTAITANAMTMSSTVSFVKTEAQSSKYWAQFASSTAVDKNAYRLEDCLTFTVTIPATKKFVPTSVTAEVGGAATGNNGAQLFVGTASAAGSNKIAKASEGGQTLTATIPSGASYTNTTFTVNLYIGNNSSSKGVDVKSVKVVGTLSDVQTGDYAPTFTTQPADAAVYLGNSTTLKCVVDANPAATYQWYSCDENGDNGVAIDGATSASYEYTPSAASTAYFYVIASNTVNSTQKDVKSNVAKVTTTLEPIAAPTFTVLGNTVQLKSTTSGATIYYEMDNADIKTSTTKSTYSGAFIPSTSGTLYAYCVGTDSRESEVVSKAITLSTVGAVVGDLLVTMQPESYSSDANYDDNKYTNGDYSLASTATLANSGRGAYVKHFKTSGTITVTAPSTSTIKSIKIYGTSNDGSKVSTITAGDGATVISSPAELMPRDVTVDGVQTMTEIVLTVTTPEAGNSVSFTLGRESRIYVEVYGVMESKSVVLNASGYATFSSSNEYEVSGATAYTATVSGTTVTLSPIEGNIIPTGEGVVLKGEANANVTLTASATSKANIVGNALKTTNGATVGSYDWVLSGSIFKHFTGDNFDANKAYLHFDSDPFGEAAKTFTIVFDEFNPTAVKNVEAADATVSTKKFFKNGQLYIQGAKGTFNATGARVK